MTRLFCVDPGAEHCGLAVLNGGGQLLITAEETPFDLVERLLMSIQRDDAPQVVFEAFTLYGGPVGASKFGSQLPEVELIGALKVICRINHVEWHSILPSQYKQMAKQWRAPLEVRGPHAFDAWSLGMWYLAFKCRVPVSITTKDGKRLDLNTPGG